MSPSILIIGASGRLGQQLINAASHVKGTSPDVHCFVRTPSKIPPELKKYCASIIQGDALVQADVRRALKESAADTVIVSIGEGDKIGPTNVRALSAKVLMRVVEPRSEFQHVRILCISSDGAGGFKLKIGMGIGKLLAHYLRHVMKDHNLQEEALKEGLGDDEAQQKRLLIVHPTELTNGKAKGEPVVYGMGDKHKTFSIDRADLAVWVVNEVCGTGKYFGSSIGITCRLSKIMR